MKQGIKRLIISVCFLLLFPFLIVGCTYEGYVKVLNENATISKISVEGQEKTVQNNGGTAEWTITWNIAEGNTKKVTVKTSTDSKVVTIKFGLITVLKVTDIE